MNIQVEYKDSSGQISQMQKKITYPAFIKHLAVAGMGCMPKPTKFIRFLRMLFFYNSFLKHFNKDKFNYPIYGYIHDPTEKSQFSNMAGEAIADFLAKKLDKAIYTVNYETVMKMENKQLKGHRPDLIAYINPTKRFAVEAKGYSKNTVNMMQHKNQAQSGPLHVDFSVACVSYNMYEKIKCKYYDPLNDYARNNEENSEKIFSKLTQKYYSGLLEFLKLFGHNMVSYGNENFYEVNFDRIYLEEMFSCCVRCLEFYKYKIILPGNIEQYAKEGLPKEFEPFIFREENENIYIDNDRVGLRILP